MSVNAKEKKGKPPVARMVESIIGCKWSLSVIAMIRNGVNRPGMMEREVEGLTTKVLNERLRKLVRYGLAEKKVFPESPPRVEYSLTAFGLKFVEVLDAITRLESDFSETTD